MDSYIVENKASKQWALLTQVHIFNCYKVKAKRQLGKPTSLIALQGRIFNHHDMKLAQDTWIFWRWVIIDRASQLTSNFCAQPTSS